MSYRENQQKNSSDSITYRCFHFLPPEIHSGGHHYPAVQVQTVPVPSREILSEQGNWRERRTICILASALTEKVCCYRFGGESNENDRIRPRLSRSTSPISAAGCFH